MARLFGWRVPVAAIAVAVFTASSATGSIIPDLPQPSATPLEYSTETSSSLLSATTPGPKLELRQVENQNATIGYALSKNEWVPWTCNKGMTWSESGQFGRCCATSATDCPQLTSCSGAGVMVFEGGSKMTCSSSLYPSCIEDIVRQDGTDNGGRTRIICDQSRFPITFYHTPPQQVITITTEAGGSVGTTTFPIPTPTPSSKNAGSTESTDSSKAWIAGAAIGGVGGVGLAIGIAWLVLWRRRTKKDDDDGVSSTGGGKGTGGAGGTTVGSINRSEMPDGSTHMSATGPLPSEPVSGKQVHHIQPPVYGYANAPAMYVGPDGQLHPAYYPLSHVHQPMPQAMSAEQQSFSKDSNSASSPISYGPYDNAVQVNMERSELPS